MFQLKIESQRILNNVSQRERQKDTQDRCNPTLLQAGQCGVTKKKQCGTNWQEILCLRQAAWHKFFGSISAIFTLN